MTSAPFVQTRPDRDLTGEQVKAIRAAYPQRHGRRGAIDPSAPTQADLARQYGVGLHTIERVIQFKTYKWVR